MEIALQQVVRSCSELKGRYSKSVFEIKGNISISGFIFLRS